MSSLFYSKIFRVSRVRAITDTGTGDEKRIGEVPTLVGLSDVSTSVGNFNPDQENRIFGYVCGLC